MSAIIWVPLALFIIILGVSFYRRSQMIREAANKKGSEKLIILTDEKFQETIETGVTLVDFWAPWCTPCRIQSPVINEIAEEMGDQAKICKLNVDNHKKAAIQMKIRNIPNIIIFNDGEAVRQIIGVKPKHAIMKALKDELEA